MDRFKSATDIVRKIYAYRANSDLLPELISNVCEYFDYAKDKDLSASDLKFLMHIANDHAKRIDTFVEFLGAGNNGQDNPDVLC